MEFLHKYSPFTFIRATFLEGKSINTQSKTTKNTAFTGLVVNTCELCVSDRMINFLLFFIIDECNTRAAKVLTTCSATYCNSWLVTKIFAEWPVFNELDGCKLQVSSLLAPYCLIGQINKWGFLPQDTSCSVHDNRSVCCCSVAPAAALRAGHVTDWEVKVER